MITILDYGMGNLGSLVNMLNRIDVSVKIEKDPENILQSEKLILPGVGSFDAAMSKIESIVGMKDALNEQALKKKIPILGICLGMQLLTRGSEEGILPGLGWIPADSIRFPKYDNLKVPHMGWNLASPSIPSLLTKKIKNDCRYYFVHSFCVKVDSPNHSIMKTHYGIVFDSGVGCNNIYGVQFHPEKSHQFGMQILENFSKI